MPRLRALLSTLAPATCLVSALALAQPLSPDREHTLTPGATFTECEHCPEMVVVPAGSFTMGSPHDESGRNSWEHPQHVVTIPRPFAIGKFEVTVEQFAAFVRDSAYRGGESCWTFENRKFDLRPNRSWRNPGYDQNGSHPATCLSWNDARAYVDWLAKKTGKSYRLLSEAEWEYAARAATTPEEATRYGFGDENEAICRHGNGFRSDWKARGSGDDAVAGAALLRRLCLHGSRGEVRCQRIRLARHAWQCEGMDCRLLPQRPGLPPRSRRRVGVDIARLPFTCITRRVLAWLRQAPARRVPLQESAGQSRKRYRPARGEIASPTVMSKSLS